MGKQRSHFHVSPRYTAGSPALVSEDIARGVAEAERSDHRHTVEGAYGEEERERGLALGLLGIAEERTEHGSGKSHGWKVTDLVTGQRFFRLCPEALQKLGWRSFNELEDWEKRLVRAQLSKHIDVERGWFKRDVQTMTMYQPKPEAS